MSSAAQQLSEPAWDNHEAENELAAVEMARHNHERDLWLQAYERHSRKPCRGREHSECVYDGQELVAPCDRHWLTDDVVERFARMVMRHG